MSCAARTAPTRLSPITPAATGTAQNVRARRARAWLAERQAELLPVPYFHVVFTLPARIAAIAYQNKAAVYDPLFKAAAQTVPTIAAHPQHPAALPHTPPARGERAAPASPPRAPPRPPSPTRRVSASSEGGVP